LRQKRSKSSQQYSESINRQNQFRCSLSDEEDDSDTEQDNNSLLTADSQITMLDGVPFGKSRRKAKSSSESIQPTRCSSQPLDYESHGDDGVEWAYGNPVPQIIKSSKSFQRNTSTARIPTSKSESKMESTIPDTLPQQALPHYLSDSGLSNSNMSVQDENSVLNQIPLQNSVSLPNSTDSINPELTGLSEESISEIPIEALLDMDANTRMHYGLANSGNNKNNPPKTQQFELSLYGEPKEGIDAKKWSENIVSFEKFCADPYKIMSNPDLRVKYNNKYMTWHDVAPYMVSLQVFGKKLCNSYRETDRIRHLSTRSYLENKQVSCESERKSESKDDNDTLSQAEVETVVDSNEQNELPEKVDLKEDSEKAAVKTSYFSMLFRSPTTEPLKLNSEFQDESHTTPQASASNPQVSIELSENPDILPKSASQFDQPKTNEFFREQETNPELTEISASRDDITVSRKLQERRSTVDVTKITSEVTEEGEDEVKKESETGSQPVVGRSLSADNDDTLADEEVETLTTRFRKSVELDSNQLRAMNLKHGRNEVVFSVTSQYQGTTKCHACIYLFKYTDKIVISDIDGTITKSDVMGMVLPAVGGGSGWTHPGVASLFRNIASNGYKFIYLSSRAIGQANMTKKYLDAVEQGGRRLPIGPVLLNPSSLFGALAREVYYRNPEEFKMRCLLSVAHIFPQKPFYAGFGNKINDSVAYEHVGIPKHRIYIINTRSEVKPQNESLAQTFTTSYETLIEDADHHFPVIKERTLSGCSPIDQSEIRSDCTTSPLTVIDQMESGNDNSKTQQILVQPETSTYGETGSPAPEFGNKSLQQPQFNTVPSTTSFNTTSFWKQPLPEVDLSMFKKKK